MELVRTLFWIAGMYAACFGFVAGLGLIFVQPIIGSAILAIVVVIAKRL